MKGVIVVTGAGGGLGSAVARVAHVAGYPVALLGRTRSKLVAVQRSLADPDRPALSIHAVDLTDEKATRREFVRIARAHGGSKIRALVNNAGTWMGTGSVEKLAASELRESLELNLFSAVHATLATLALTSSRPKHPLAIVNVGATASLDCWPEVLPFSLAKGALRGFSRALARELGPKGVHVAHLIIDGMLDNARTRKLNRSLAQDRFLDTAAVARGILGVIEQERSSWTAEWDVRPFNESW
jgi:short-subunit dehydrogenase